MPLMSSNMGVALPACSEMDDRHGGPGNSDITIKKTARSREVFVHLGRPLSCTYPRLSHVHFPIDTRPPLVSGQISLPQPRRPSSGAAFDRAPVAVADSVFSALRFV